MIQWFTKKLNIKMNEYDNFIDLLTNLQIDKFGKKLQSYLLGSTSYHDLTEEKDYHNLVGGLLAPLTTRYNIESNREVGYGRCDHILTSIVGRGDNAIIVEYKVAKSSEDLNDIAKAGLQQIMDKKYDTKIKEHQHVKNIIKISMAFCGKNMELQYEVTKRESSLSCVSIEYHSLKFNLSGKKISSWETVTAQFGIGIFHFAVICFIA
ncbi:MAG: PD-(D/E)XK nuclease domain-containing protein, partial [Rickettsia endosymbiont of Platyusa sonomae]|nr:PD-(D/E)XK nuclease domain-containing protein [Rickettsia endosymbiont of Platyusa sonomae]